MEKADLAVARGGAQRIIEAGERQGFAQGEIEVSSVVISQPMAYGQIEDAVVRNRIGHVNRKTPEHIEEVCRMLL